MFLRWRHRKTTARFKGSSRVYCSDSRGMRLVRYSAPRERVTERLTVALVESVRVNGRPRLRVVRHLGAWDPVETKEAYMRELMGTGWGFMRRIMERMRELDIPAPLKERFLKEIEARAGVPFDWPESLNPMTWREQEAQAARAEQDEQEMVASLRGQGYK